MKQYDVIVIGGGWAGLAAATNLAEKGVQVLLLERNQSLGGRACSFWDEEFGEWLDNGPHVFIGAYSAAIGLLKKWRSADAIDFTDGSSIPFVYPEGRKHILKLGGTGKLGALAGLLSFRGMSVSDLLRTIRVVEALMKFDEQKRVVSNVPRKPVVSNVPFDTTREPTVADFLSRYGIGEGDCGGFWDALTVAVLNAPPQMVGILPLMRAIREGLLVGGDNARLGIPVKPFKELYIEPARVFLEGYGIEIRTGVEVKSVIINNKGTVIGVDMTVGKMGAKNVVAAVSPSFLMRLLPGDWQNNQYFSRFNQFEAAPIAAVHLTFDKPVLSKRFAFFPKAFVHWVFGRGEPVDGGWARISTVTSYAPTREQMSNEDVLHWVTNDLRERLPEFAGAEVKYIRIVRTMNATVILKPGSDLIRPSAETLISGLYLACDWCATGLPATIESAARSGEMAAQKVVDLL